MRAERATTSSPRITVSICTYDRYDYLPAAIESVLAQQLTDGVFDLVVVDNTPPAKRKQQVRDRFASASRLTYLVEETPGLSNARNVSLRHSRAPYVVFLDDDAVAREGWLEAVLAGFALPGRQVGVVGGRVCPIWADAEPTWLHPDMRGALTIVDWGGSLRIAGAGEWFAGANVAFDRAAALEAGGFPTGLGRVGGGKVLLSNEESVMIEKLEASGYERAYAPDAIVDHHVPTARLAQQWHRKRAAWQAVSDYLKNSETATGTPPARAVWSHVVDFFDSRPADRRTVRSLFENYEDPDEFRWQTGAIYGLMTILLEGLTLDDDGPAE